MMHAWIWIIGAMGLFALASGGPATDFSNTSLRGTSLGGATLAGVIINGTDFNGADLASTRLIDPIGFDAAKNFDKAQNLDRLLRE
jgi:uncharacterized protein YjbI with pentapeptide repeats